MQSWARSHERLHFGFGFDRWRVAGVGGREPTAWFIVASRDFHIVIDPCGLWMGICRATVGYSVLRC